jgi:ADP-ribose pyrophosphatase
MTDPVSHSNAFGWKTIINLNSDHLFEACGYADQGFHVFLATGLPHRETNREHQEQDLVKRDFVLSEVERIIRNGEIKDGTTVATLGLLRLKDLL